MGASRMTMWMNSKKAVEMVSRPRSIGARRSGLSIIRPKPKMSAITSTCRISPRAKAPTKLSGKTFSRNWSKVVCEASAAFTAAAAPFVAPAEAVRPPMPFPMPTRLPKRRPRTSATLETTSK